MTVSNDGDNAQLEKTIIGITITFMSYIAYIYIFTFSYSFGDTKNKMFMFVLIHLIHWHKLLLIKHSNLILQAKS